MAPDAFGSDAGSRLQRQTYAQHPARLCQLNTNHRDISGLALATSSARSRLSITAAIRYEFLQREFQGFFDIQFSTTTQAFPFRLLRANAVVHGLGFSQLSFEIAIFFHRADPPTSSASGQSAPPFVLDP